jgi:hypothetical protein
LFISLPVFDACEIIFVVLAEVLLLGDQLFNFTDFSVQSLCFLKIFPFGGFGLQVLFCEQLGLQLGYVSG